MFDVPTITLMNYSLHHSYHGVTTKPQQQPAAHSRPTYKTNSIYKTNI